MHLLWLLEVLLQLAGCVAAFKFDAQFDDWNLNKNQYAVRPEEYWGEWTGHKYTPSPKNWRFPFYTVMPDRFINGDPHNDNINGTQYERDPESTQLRYGGDVAGLIDSLDYISGMGIKGIYIAGSFFMNLPWTYDQYSPIDLTLLDQHLGDLGEWQTLMDAIHSRGMYAILDNTFATLGDLIGFEGHLNTSAPFNPGEYPALYKTARQYGDFHFGTEYNDTCDFPEFWLETGFPVDHTVTDQFHGCFDGEFDQFGDTEAFGVYPDWRRQITKFASVQDRLREWYPPVQVKLQNFYCMAIAQLDVDGFRYDKATQSTVDALGTTNKVIRKCAAQYGKKNFFLPGEITGGNNFGAVYLGRGRQPNQYPSDPDEAFAAANNGSDALDPYSLRDDGLQALDSAAFHYSTYRALVRFLGMDGNLEAAYDTPLNFVDMWNTFLLTNDFYNPSTGEFDPRHLFGVTNQDVFRWPAITNGTERQLLGHFVTTLLLPGIPLLLWGEEQEFHVLDNTAANYVFGRQAMGSCIAWQRHGCYSLESQQYYKWPLDRARTACHDDSVSYDHRDPAAPVRNALKHMFQLRDTYPVLNDGFYLQQLSNQTEPIQYPGSSGKVTETGMWSVMRSFFPGRQNSSDDDQRVWLLFSNLNDTRDYQFDCSDESSDFDSRALIAPFDAGTTVQNLLPPFDTIKLVKSTQSLGFGNSSTENGCVPSMEMKAYEFRAYVPKSAWFGVKPYVTKFLPGHDARLIAASDASGTERLSISFEFTIEMDCDAITRSISFESSARTATPNLRNESIKCGNFSELPPYPTYTGTLSSAYRWSGELENVDHGILAIYVDDPRDATGTTSTKARDKFLVRIGMPDNPMVFPTSANYSTSLVSAGPKDMLTLTHSAPGAELWRYSTNWGSSYSDWMPYSGGASTVDILPWNGTAAQSWEGHHVRVEYWNHLAGSADHVVSGDEGGHVKARRFPQLFAQGPWNLYGFDSGTRNVLSHTGDGTWQFYFLVEWPAILQLNVWGIDLNKQPDKTVVLGDVDGDSVLDRQPPNALVASIINITEPPPVTNVAWSLKVDDGTGRFTLTPAGHATWQLILFIFLWVVPLITAIAGVWLYKRSFYGVKFEEYGLVERVPWLSSFTFGHEKSARSLAIQKLDKAYAVAKRKSKKPVEKALGRVSDTIPILAQGPDPPRRTVLIATMEYDIEDWEIKIKIGGLGVMAQLMGKNLTHQDLVWVVPKVGDVQYPDDEEAEAMTVKILGKAYKVLVQYHRLKNITYVLLDAPVFRAQTKSDPYPSRMDDMSSAIYYSAWNQCIAQAIERFPVQLYHVNDYHGTLAPLYLLPSTIPVCLSLHNAEFQGLWPMRTPHECDEVSKIFNIPSVFVQEFVQFGTVFNLLHAGASYLRVYQQGFGAVGVSKKYGVRSWLRYPIFWGLRKVGQLPNPDPTDTADTDKRPPREQDIVVDPAFEAKRPGLKAEAQKWAGLDQNPDADLFVFVGRWSTQKGIDLIADVFPAVLEAHSNVQLICIGPIIDLYGRFAAAKLDRMMKIHPGRVFSRPVFTALPPCIFSGADFALIPSRDEPFGLVAVEFGRKGAICVGSRVGGLGQMPGWWFTVESMEADHLLEQFKQAVTEALRSKPATRAMMRARSAKQRFPVKQWLTDLETLQATAIKVHRNGPPVDVARHKPRAPSRPRRRLQRRSRPGHDTPTSTNTGTPHYDSSSSRTVDPFPSERASIASVEAYQPSEYEPTFRDGFLSADESHDEMDQNRGRFGDKTPRRWSIHQSREIPEVCMTPALDEITSARHDTATGRDQFAEDLAVCLQTEPDIGETERSDPIEWSSGESVLSSGVGTPRAALSEARAVSMIHAVRVAKEAGYQDSEITASRGRPALAGDVVVGARQDYKLQQVDPFFTDPSGEYQQDFERKLEKLNGSNSESRLCIQEFLMKSEKTFFSDYRNKKLGITVRDRRRHPRTASSTTVAASRPPSAIMESTGADFQVLDVPGEFKDELKNIDEGENDLSKQWGIPKSHVAPRGLKKWMQIRLGDWPVYAFFLVVGQIIAANSYQIVLLTGQVGQNAAQVYIISSIYAIASVVWWLCFRRFGSRLCLSAPFIFYSLAFLFVGLGRFAAAGTPRSWMNNFGSGAYAAASASGVFFFVLNFGDEGGSQVKSWVFRACVIQGFQQMYVVILWFWGYHVNRTLPDGSASPVRSFANSPYMTVIGIALSLLFLALGAVLWIGLPDYYHQTPGSVSDFYRSIFRRKIVNWFFVAVLIQNFFLSTQYGRSWSFLFASAHVEWWTIFLLVVFFFIIVWALAMWGFSWLTRSHSWMLPIFAIGLGAPRWAQVWWGTSSMAVWLPWSPGGYIGSALLSRCLWLWLGVLDTVQGVGLGMILLSTLTRLHVLFTLIVAQVLGAATTAFARGVSPAKLGPGPLFPDLTEGAEGLRNAWFWIGLGLNLSLCIGFFKFFRKEQLTKP